MNAHITPDMRELDSRRSGDVHVRLLWRPSDDRVVVSVLDWSNHESLVVDVRKGDAPLDAFHHPYAYAEWRHGDRTGTTTRSRLDQFAA